MADIAGEDAVTAKWHARAEELLERALSEHRDLDGNDPIPTASAALAALHIEQGELPEDELMGWFDDCGPTAVCICPPALVARGGFRSGCPVHHHRGRT